MNDEVYSSEDKAEKLFWKSDYTSVLSSIEKRNFANEAIESLNLGIEDLDQAKSTILYVDSDAGTNYENNQKHHKPQVQLVFSDRRFNSSYQINASVLSI
jgi:hypothetical protein